MAFDDQSPDTDCMDTITYLLPSRWAAGLIYEDASGLKDEEAQLLCEFLLDERLGDLIRCSADPEFETYHDVRIYGVPPCDCLTYTFRVLEQ